MEFFPEDVGFEDSMDHLFSSKLYQQSMKTCWHEKTYKTQVLILKELLSLQQKHIIPNFVTVDDMIDLIREIGRIQLGEKLWHFDVEMLDDEDEKSLLFLAWKVNVSNKLRDILEETQSNTSDHLLIASESQRCKIRSLCRRYVSVLTQNAVEAFSAKLTSLTDVVLAVVPQVLQGFWVRPTDAPALDSQKLSRTFVTVTKAVLDQISNGYIKNFFFIPFSREIRVDLVQSIQDTIREMYPADVLQENVAASAPEFLGEIINVSVECIRPMFPVPIIPKPAPIQTREEEESEEEFLGSAVVLPEEENAQPEPEPIPGNPRPRMGFRRNFYQFLISICLFAGIKVNM